MSSGLSGRAETLLGRWRRGPQYITVVLSLLTLCGFALLFYRIHHARTTQYSYNSLYERFYQFAEAEQDSGASTSDLFILNSSGEDCWFRYYIIFLTGAEARTLNEVVAYDVAATDVRAKYLRAHFVLPVSDTPPEIATARTISVINQYQILSFDTHALKQDYANILKSWVAESPQDRLHLKSLQAPCYWLEELSEEH
jgi:hypothetical protein